MCGRYELNSTPKQLQDHFGDLIPSDAWNHLGLSNSYNIAPSQPCLVIRYSKRVGHNVIEPLTWGFRPGSARKNWINARADTLFKLALFRRSAERRRCLVVATGWYEWQASGGKHRRPYYIHLARPFAFAGVWTARQVPEGWELNFAIVTTAARGLVESIHERMPLVMHPRHYAAWLEPQTEEPRALMTPFEDPQMRAYAVSTRVNDPKNDSPGCIEPAGGERGEPMD